MTAPAESQLPKPQPSERTPAQRLMAVDALRGFDMFWIIGADALARIPRPSHGPETDNPDVPLSTRYSVDSVGLFPSGDRAETT